MTDGGVLHIEDGLPEAVLDELRAPRPPSWSPSRSAPTAATRRSGATRSTGVYSGATEKRKDGCALGY